MIPLCFVDCETTGLDNQRHEIVEIGAVMEGREPFSVKVHPMSVQNADPKALEINGYDKKKWLEEAYLLANGLKLLSEYAIGSYLIAYNATFDVGFLEKAYKECDLDWPFHYHKLDLLTLAWYKLPDQRSLSLKNVCLALEIKPEGQVHHALAGATKAMEVYKKLTL